MMNLKKIGQVTNIVAQMRCTMATAANGAKPKTYSVSGEGKSWSANTKTESGYSCPVDLPKKMGGEGLGPSPIELFLASVIGCEYITA